MRRAAAVVGVVEGREHVLWPAARRGPSCRPASAYFHSRRRVLELGDDADDVVDVLQEERGRVQAGVAEAQEERQAPRQLGGRAPTRADVRCARRRPWGAGMPCSACCAESCCSHTCCTPKARRTPDPLGARRVGRHQLPVFHSVPKAASGSTGVLHVDQALLACHEVGAVARAVGHRPCQRWVGRRAHHELRTMPSWSGS